MRLLRLLLAAAVTASPALRAQERPWSIDPKPALILGNATDDKAVLFGAGLVGATQLPDGRILVADRGDYSLKVFDRTGKLVKSLGRNGSGPGEIIYVSDLWRCGDQVVVYDIENGYRVTVFSTDLVLKRSFRFGGPPGQQTPYSSACNAAGTFAHFGWEDRREMKAKAFRANVPRWISGIDSTVRPFGEMPGSERWGLVVDGAFRGTRPLPLGKQPVIGIGSDRVYTGTADSYEIAMYDLQGQPMGRFGKPGVQLATTKADIDLAIEDEAAGKDDAARERVRNSFAAMELPKTIPAYKALVVDSDDMVWIRDYRRASPSTVTWTVFTRDGKQVTEVALPLQLTVFEIGRDYVLGKFIDPAEDIPEIRLYRIRRGNR